MKPRASAVHSTPVRAHERIKPASALYNSTSFALMRETGFVPDILKSRIERRRVRVKAGRKVQ